MSDNDMIRRGDAMKCCASLWPEGDAARAAETVERRLSALPAAPPDAVPEVERLRGEVHAARFDLGIAGEAAESLRGDLDATTAALAAEKARADAAEARREEDRLAHQEAMRAAEAQIDADGRADVERCNAAVMARDDAERRLSALDAAHKRLRGAAEKAVDTLGDTEDVYSRRACHALRAALDAPAPAPAETDAAEKDAEALAAAGVLMLHCLGEYARQTMAGNREWRDGVVAIEAALFSHRKRVGMPPIRTHDDATPAATPPAATRKAPSADEIAEAWTWATTTEGPTLPRFVARLWASHPPATEPGLRAAAEAVLRACAPPQSGSPLDALSRALAAPQPSLEALGRAMYRAEDPGAPPDGWGRLKASDRDYYCERGARFLALLGQPEAAPARGAEPACVCGCTWHDHAESRGGGHGCANCDECGRYVGKPEAAPPSERESASPKEDPACIVCDHPHDDHSDQMPYTGCSRCGCLRYRTGNMGRVEFWDCAGCNQMIWSDEDATVAGVKWWHKTCHRAALDRGISPAREAARADAPTPPPEPAREPAACSHPTVTIAHDAADRPFWKCTGCGAKTDDTAAEEPEPAREPKRGPRARLLDRATRCLDALDNLDASGDPPLPQEAMRLLSAAHHAIAARALLPARPRPRAVCESRREPSLPCAHRVTLAATLCRRPEEWIAYDCDAPAGCGAKAGECCGGRGK